MRTNPYNGKKTESSNTGRNAAATKHLLVVSKVKLGFSLDFSTKSSSNSDYTDLGHGSVRVFYCTGPQWAHDQFQYVTVCCCVFILPGSPRVTCVCVCDTIEIEMWSMDVLQDLEPTAAGRPVFV